MPVCPIYRASVSRGGGGVDFEDGVFELLQVGDHREEVARLRVSLRAEHPHQALGRLRQRASEQISPAPPGIMEAGISMDKTVRKVTDLAKQQAETYRYWRSRPSAERFEATWELSRDLYREFYRQKGIVPHGEGSARSLARVQRPAR